MILFDIKTIFFYNYNTESSWLEVKTFRRHKKRRAMNKRQIAPASLKNLIRSNKESNQITKEAIETALLFLLEKKDLQQISISELVKKAGVSRNAFYRNYKSKEEILEHAYERTSSILAHKWQNLQERVQRQGLPQFLSDVVQDQKEKVGKSQSLSNVSQWIKERTSKTIKKD